MIERHEARLLPLASYWIEVGGLQIHFRASPAAGGGGTPIVLVHGLTVSGRYLLPLAALLLADYTVYVPDLPGFGESEKPSHVLDTREMAEVLACWMAAAGLERAFLLGNSLGCYTAAALAARHPQRVRRLVLVSPPGDPQGRHASHLIWRAANDFVREPWSLLPILLQDLARAGLRRTLLTFRYMLRDRLQTWLPRVQTPTLVVGGGKGRIVPEAWVRRVARLLPQGEAVIIPGAGHAANYSHPRELAALVHPFLER